MSSRRFALAGGMRRGMRDARAADYVLPASGIFWYRAEDAVVTSDPDIDSVPDQGPFGADLAQGTPAARPHLVADGGVGATMEFTTVASKILADTTANVSGLGDFVNFTLAFRMRSVGTHGLLSLSATGALATGVCDLFIFSGNLTFRAGSAAGGMSASVAFSDTADYHVVTGRWNAAGISLSLDGGTPVAGPLSNAGANQLGTQLFLGDNYAAYCDCNIAELIGFNGDADVDAADIYLQGKY